MVSVIEPNISSSTVGAMSNLPVDEGVAGSDIAVLLVGHSEFVNLSFQTHTVILDFCGLNHTN